MLIVRIFYVTLEVERSYHSRKMSFDHRWR